MVAAFAMYDLPELVPAWELIWTFVFEMLLSAGLQNPPARLTWGEQAIAAWEQPGLLLGQTCGYPYATRLKSKVDYVATFDFDLEELPPGCYRSYVVTRRDDPAEDLRDLEGAAFAFNGPDSQSGCRALLRAFSEAGLMPPDLASAQLCGSHRAAMAAVVAGKARFASIDSVTFAQVLIYRPEEIAALKVVAATEPTPGLPLVTTRLADRAAAARRVAILRWALGEAMAAPALVEARDALSLKGITVFEDGAYDALAAPLQVKA